MLEAVRDPFLPMAAVAGALLLVGAASLPNLFDPILMQYQMILDFFHLQDCGKVLVRSVKEKGDIIGHPALDAAYRLGVSIA